MTAGLVYYAFDPQLIIDRDFAKSVCKEFNEANSEARMEIIGKVLNIKKTSSIEPPFRSDYGYNIYLGENTKIGKNSIILDGAPVRIGDNTIIYEDSNLYTATHPLDYKRRINMEEFSTPITIGNRCIIGRNVTFCPGSEIGDNVIVASDSVVTKRTPGNCIISGNPARVVREISSDISESEILELVK